VWFTGIPLESVESALIFSEQAALLRVPSLFHKRNELYERNSTLEVGMKFRAINNTIGVA